MLPQMTSMQPGSSRLSAMRTSRHGAALGPAAVRDIAVPDLDPAAALGLDDERS
jgi:hypothetical protein